MNKIILYSIFVFLLIFGISTTIGAQVTIGLDEVPLEGALLQLKNIKGNGLENSTKGLGMPRIQLQSLTGDLAKSLNATASDGDLDPEAHIGLLIYNVPKDPACPAIDPGLHAWSGAEWLPLVKKDLSRIGSVTGKSGATYRTRVFGSAGEWMIDNLREIEYELPETGVLLINLKPGAPGHTEKACYFPANGDDNHTGNIEHDRKLFDAHPKIGLLYTANGASNGQISDSFTIGAGAVKSTVQGICPAGWRLPSDKDWNKLEKEIATYPELYSKSPVGSTMWSSAPGQGGTPDGDWSVYDTGLPRPSAGYNGHGLSMMLCQAAPASGFSNSKGTSTEDGFCGMKAGQVVSSGGEGRGYGFIAMYWSSSEYSIAMNWQRTLLGQEVGVRRAYLSKEIFISVRCKKAD